MAIAKYKNLTYEYESEHLDIHELPEIKKEDAREVLFKTQDIFKTFGIDIYLAFGTLLGAVRDKDFIDGDLDVDCFVKDEEKLFKNLSNIETQGLKLIRAANYIYSFRYHNNPKCYIDVYICCPTYTIWRIYCYRLVSSMVPKKYLQDGKIEFLGREFLCPKNPENILKFWYTDTWNIPIGKFDKTYKCDVTSHYYYKMLPVYIKSFIRKVIGDRSYLKIKNSIKGQLEENRCKYLL